jgi:hypothetical protein
LGGPGRRLDSRRYRTHKKKRKEEKKKIKKKENACSQWPAVFSLFIFLKKKAIARDFGGVPDKFTAWLCCCLAAAPAQTPFSLSVSCVCFSFFTHV